MTFLVAEECRRLGLRAGAVVFRKLRLATTVPELRAESAGEVERVRRRFASRAAIRALPELVRFQEIHRAVGARKEVNSIERLLTFALKRGELPAINSLVDAYNLASLRSCCSLGAHDLERITLPVTLRLLTGQEAFTPLGSNQPMPVTPGEFGYVDGAGRLLCRLDVVQADFSKVTLDTVNALLIIEATDVHDPVDLTQAFAATIELVQKYCLGEAEVVAYPEYVSKTSRVGCSRDRQ